MKKRLIIISVSLAFILTLFACAGINKSKREKGVSLNIDSSKLEESFSGVKRLGLFIGINDFDDFKNLKYASKDAKDLFDSLKHFEYKKLLTTKEETTKENILKELEKLKIENVNPDSQVIVMISSHGTLSIDPFGNIKQFLVTSDTDKGNLLKTGINLQDLSDIFDGLVSKKKAVIRLFCHSGEGKSELSKKVKAKISAVKSKSSDWVDPFSKISRSSIIISSSEASEKSLEDDSLKNDIFLHYFVKAITNKIDQNNDSAVSILEAYDYANTNTLIYTNKKQRPTINMQQVGIDPIILAGKREGKGLPVLWANSKEYNNYMIKSNGTVKGSLPQFVELNTGKQRIELLDQNDEVVLAKNVYLSLGENISIEELFDRDEDIGSEAGLKTGVYTATNSGYKTAFPVSIYYKLLNKWPDPEFPLRFDLDFSGRFMNMTANEQFDSYTSGDLKIEGKAARYGFFVEPSINFPSIWANGGVEEGFWDKVSFLLGANLGMEYATFIKNFTGTGSFVNASDFNSDSTDKFLSYGGKFVVRYSFSKYLAFFSEFNYNSAIATFNLAKNDLSGNREKVNYDLSGMVLGVGIGYKF